MMKSMKAIFAKLVLLIILFVVGCGDSGESSNSTSHVTITKKPMYYEVTIDYSSGERYNIGREYGIKVKREVPPYEAAGDEYLKRAVKAIGISYNELIWRSLDIAENIQPEYMAEIEGFASVLSGGTSNELGDGKLSRDEYLMLNFTPDVFTHYACSAAAVFGARSATGQTIIGRNTDWATGPPQAYPELGSDPEANLLNAIVYLRTKEKELLAFGNLGMIGMIVGINSDGIFVSNLYSDIGAAYSAVGKRSVMLDIRKALETSATIDEAGAFLGDPSRIYAYHNNMFIADRNTAKVLENDYKRNRTLRVVDSKLNDGITWGISDAIACVNAFVLYGNHNNFTGKEWQEDRWKSFKTLLVQEGDTLDVERMKTIMSYYFLGPGSGEPGKNPADIFNEGTIQSMAYSYAENRLELWLGTFVEHPQYVTISIPFLEDQDISS